jgi:hypothetical protein
MIKVYPVKCEAVDEADEVAFVVDTFDADCFSLEVKTLVDSDNWPGIADAVKFTLAYMSAGLTVADPPESPDA